MRVLGHEKQTPLECDCRRVRPRSKQIQHTVDQVVLMIERILESRLLTHDRDELKDGRVRLILGGDRVKSKTPHLQFQFPGQEGVDEAPARRRIQTASQISDDVCSVLDALFQIFHHNFPVLKKRAKPRNHVVDL